MRPRVAEHIHQSGSFSTVEISVARKRETVGKVGGGGWGGEEAFTNLLRMVFVAARKRALSLVIDSQAVS